MQYSMPIWLAFIVVVTLLVAGTLVLEAIVRGTRNVLKDYERGMPGIFMMTLDVTVLLAGWLFGLACIIAAGKIAGI